MRQSYSWMNSSPTRGGAPPVHALRRRHRSARRLLEHVPGPIDRLPGNQGTLNVFCSSNCPSSVGWSFPDHRRWSSLQLQQGEARPFSNPDLPCSVVARGRGRQTAPPVISDCPDDTCVARVMPCGCAGTAPWHGARGVLEHRPVSGSCGLRTAVVASCEPDDSNVPGSVCYVA